MLLVIHAKNFAAVNIIPITMDSLLEHKILIGAMVNVLGAVASSCPEIEEKLKKDCKVLDLEHTCWDYIVDNSGTVERLKPVKKCTGEPVPNSHDLIPIFVGTKNIWTKIYLQFTINWRINNKHQLYDSAKTGCDHKQDEVYQRVFPDQCSYDSDEKYPQS